MHQIAGSGEVEVVGILLVIRAQLEEVMEDIMEVEVALLDQDRDGMIVCIYFREVMEDIMEVVVEVVLHQDRINGWIPMFFTELCQKFFQNNILR